MAKTRMLTTHFHVAWWIEGEKLNKDKVNLLIPKFTDMFRNFKIERENYRAICSCCGDSIFQEVDTRKVKCSSHLTFEIFCSSPSNDISKRALSHEESAQIHNGLKVLFLTDGKYSNKVNFTVKDTHQGSSPPMSHEQSVWPMQRW